MTVSPTIGHGCGCFSGMAPRAPPPQTSPYFRDESASFAVNTKQEQLTARYSWMVQLTRALPSGAYVEAEFPDPQQPSTTPYRVPFRRIQQQPQPQQYNQEPNEEGMFFYAVSPELQGFQCRVYPVTLNVYQDARRLQLVTQHRSHILSRISTEHCTKDDFFAWMDKVARSQD